VPVEINHWIVAYFDSALDTGNFLQSGVLGAGCEGVQEDDARNSGGGSLSKKFSRDRN
jgi:hypothetical protein